jgi:CRP/FNR family cyclic AMP-dependent transcriptional regulator
MPNSRSPPSPKRNAQSAALHPTSVLRAIRLLANVPEEVLQGVSRQCIWLRVQPDQLSVSRQAKDQDVYFIVAGAVRVTAFSARGRQVTYRDLHRGEWFGDLAAIDRRLRSADVVARAETLLASICATEFIQLIAENPGVADAQVKHLVDWVRDLTDRLFDLSTLGVQNRVDAELLRLAKEAGVVGNVARIDPAPRHSDIASQVSTYREQATRELSQLAKLGLLERDGGALVVRDVSRLERMVAEVRRTA